MVFYPWFSNETFLTIQGFLIRCFSVQGFLIICFSIQGFLIKWFFIHGFLIRWFFTIQGFFVGWLLSLPGARPRLGIGTMITFPSIFTVLNKTNIAYFWTRYHLFHNLWYFFHPYFSVFLFEMYSFQMYSFLIIHTSHTYIYSRILFMFFNWCSLYLIFNFVSLSLCQLEVLTWAPPDFIQLILLTIYCN